MLKSVHNFSYIINFLMYDKIMNTLIENWFEFWRKSAGTQKLPTANDLSPAPAPLKDFVAIHCVKPVCQLALGPSASECSKNLRKHHSLSKRTLDELGVGFRQAVCTLRPILTTARFSAPGYTLEMLQTPALTPNHRTLLVFTLLVTTKSNGDTGQISITHTPL